MDGTDQMLDGMPTNTILQEDRAALCWQAIIDARWRWLLRYGRIIFMLILLVGCGAKPGYSGSLRGDTLLYLRLPLQGEQQEAIETDKQHLASRSFEPITVRTHINTVVIPEPLWIDLENLRQSWCDHPPPSISRIPNDTAFEVVFQCHILSGFNNTVYFLQPTEVPPPLRALIDLVPSTSVRLIVP